MQSSFILRVVITLFILGIALGVAPIIASGVSLTLSDGSGRVDGGSGGQTEIAVSWTSSGLYATGSQIALSISPAATGTIANCGTPSTDFGGFSGSFGTFTTSSAVFTLTQGVSTSTAGSLCLSFGLASATTEYTITMRASTNTEAFSAHDYGAALYDVLVTEAAESKLTASDGAADDAFGWKLSISGDYAIMSAYGDDDNGDRSGSAYIFHHSSGTWTQQAKLIASDGAPVDVFGLGVVIEGDYAVVGAEADDDNGSYSGSAYIFYRNQGGENNWGEVTKITASDGAAGDRFGEGVGINGDYVIVGAGGDDSNTGSAYIFYKDQGGTDNWGEVTKITASDGAAGAHFGYAPAIDGDYVVVGAWADDDDGANSGSAYIFYKDQGGTDNWGEVTKITASDGAAQDAFGDDVDIDENYVIVGSPRNNGNNGSAYIFYKDQGGTDNWGEFKKLTASDGVADDYFAHNVGISGDYAVASAYSYNDGYAYIFHKDRGGTDNWGEFKKLTASDGVADDYFGATSAIDGNFVIVGAYSDDDNGTDSGSAYIYPINDIPGNEVTVTTEVLSFLSFSIRDSDDAANTNACALGTLDATQINYCSYRLRIATNAANGFTATIETSGDFTNGSASLNPIANDVLFATGTEAYGLAFLTGAISGGRSGVDVYDQPVTEAGASTDASLTFDTDSSPITFTSATTILSYTAPFNPAGAPSITTTSEVVHGAAVSSSTTRGTYSQTITYRVTGSF